MKQARYISEVDSAVFRRLKFVPRRKVRRVFGGEFESPFVGEGQEFYGLRPYSRGDDPRKIHWQHSAQTGELTIREEVAERQSRIWIVCDLSSSVQFGSKPILIGGFLLFASHLAREGGNAVGVMGFADNILVWSRPQGGRKTAKSLQFLKNQLEAGTERKVADIAVACDFLRERTRPGDVIFFVSDFLLKGDLRAKMGIFSRSSEFIPVVARDPRERFAVPNVRVAFEDLETARTFDGPSQKPVLEQHDAGLRSFFGEFALDYIWIEGTRIEHAIEAIAQWLRQRNRYRR